MRCHFRGDNGRFVGVRVYMRVASHAVLYDLYSKKSSFRISVVCCGFLFVQRTTKTKEENIIYPDDDDGTACF